MVTSPEYRHVPTGTLALLAQRLGTVSASPSTWYGLVRKYNWRRPRLRVHPAKPKVGLRTTVIRLLDGIRAYVHAVIDNFSRRILAWRVADTFARGFHVRVLSCVGAYGETCCRTCDRPESTATGLSTSAVRSAASDFDPGSSMPPRFATRPGG
jgi:hypothetical protein